MKFAKKVKFFFEPYVTLQGGADSLSVFLPSARRQFTLWDDGYGLRRSASRGVPVYVSVFVDVHCVCPPEWPGWVDL